MKRSLVKLVLWVFILPIVLGCPSVTRAGEGQSTLAEAAKYIRSNFGIAIKQVLLDISEKDSDDTVALLEGDLVVWPFLSFQSPTRYFGQSRFGWLMEYGLSGFGIDKQSEPFSTFDATDRGTAVDGWFIYAMPTVTWDPSDTFRLGFGLGGGILSVRGDALIYDPFPTVNRIRYDFTKLTWGGYLLAEYVVNSFMIGAHVGALLAEEGPYDYIVSDTSLIIAYHKML